MSNIKVKSDYLKDTKQAIKLALQVIGAPITDETPFRQYANVITTTVGGITADVEDYVWQVVDLIHCNLTGATMPTAEEYAAARIIYENIAQIILGGNFQ